MNTPDPALRHAIGLMRANRLAEAQGTLSAACRSPGATAEHWFVLGAVRHMLGSAQDALVAFERALALQPDHPNALNASASVLATLGRNDDALACLRQALALRPRDVDAHVNTALVLERTGHTLGALDHYTAALSIDPSCRAARLNRSALHLTLQRLGEALRDADLLLESHPQDIAARCNRAKALLGMDRYAEVVATCDAILAADAGHVGANIDRAVALACLGRFDASRAGFAAARSSDPAMFSTMQRHAWESAGADLRRAWTHGADDLPDPRSICLSRGTDRLARCDWTGRDAFLAAFEAIVRDGVARNDPVCDWSLPFASMWLPLADDVRLALADAVCRRVEVGISPLPLQRAHPPARRSTDPLRIGYVSPKFRDHPGATLCPPILEQHDRSRVRVYGYALNPYDPGALAARFRGSCDAMRECWGQDDAAIARQIRDDGIHILVDVGGYTDYARPEVFAQKPAPVQAAYVGFMTSMAAAWMDYFLTDAVATPPEHAALWRERLVHLPRTLLCYDPPPSALPSPPSRADCGLPDAGFVFCCFSNPYKIEPRAFRIWMRLLDRVPGSVLWLLRDHGSDANLRTEARACGIDPQRLVFADRIDRTAHLARQQLADLFLDTFDYNAHTTAAEAYYAALPVLTLPGRTTVARCGASIAYGVGMNELIAHDESDYEARAYRFATCAQALAAVRERLLKTRAQLPLFDARSLARSFEQAFEHMWARHEAGLPPATFTVPAQAPGERVDRALLAPFVVSGSSNE